MKFNIVFMCCMTMAMYAAESPLQQQAEALKRMAAINAGAAKRFNDPITKSRLNEVLAQWRTILDPAKRATVTLQELNQAVREYIRMLDAIVIADNNVALPQADFAALQHLKNQWIEKIVQLFPLDGDDVVITHFMLYLQPPSEIIQPLKDEFVRIYFPIAESVNADAAFDQKNKVLLKVRKLLREKGFSQIVHSVDAVHRYYQEPYVEAKIEQSQAEDARNMAEDQKQ